MEQKIRDALSKLDLTDEKLWTADGLPKLDAPGLGGKFSRADVTKAAPLFSRTKPDLTLGGPPTAEDDEEQVDEGDRKASAAPEVDTVFAMKASDFGEDPEGEEGVDGGHKPPARMSPEEVEERIARAEKMLKEASSAAEYAERMKSDAAEQRDKAVREQEFLDSADPHKNQRGIMAYLESTKKAKPAEPDAKAPTAPAMSPIDKALSMRRAPYGTARPNYPRQS